MKRKYRGVFVLCTMLLLMTVGLGCDRDRRIEELEAENSSLKTDNVRLGDENMKKEKENSTLYASIVVATILAFFFGTAIGLKCKRDAQKNPRR